jgi:predicted enzyme related to lactoylglutathione lyase
MSAVETKLYAPGTFCWAELHKTDQGAAKTFYGNLLGWNYTGEPVPDGSVYHTAQVGDKPVAATTDLRQEMKDAGVPSCWVQYVSVDNVDVSAGKVQELGGKLMGPLIDVMTYGRMAMCADPTGAAFCLWQAGSHQGAMLRDDVGAMAWNELYTNDTGKAQAFYTSLFNWGTEKMEGPMDYTMFKNQDTLRESRSAGGMMAISEEMAQVPPNWLVYFCVANCDETVAKAPELGGKAIVPGQDIPGIGRFAILQDPQGAAFGIIQFAN